MQTSKAKDINEYISGFPHEVKIFLEQIRLTIREAAPEAEEAIKYDMPTFNYNGNLVHFAAFQNHIGFYPAPTGLVAFKDELSDYKQGKGSVQFPMDQPMPLNLISRIVKHWVAVNVEKKK
jgi:uncharacterized protein YdhG (YjbR/CyaY superfamily)